MNDSKPESNDVLVAFARSQQMAKRRYLKNKVVILEAMEKEQIACLHVAYSGSGDSGCVDGVSAKAEHGKDINPLEASFVEVCVGVGRLGGRHWQDAPETKSVSLFEAAETFAYDWLEFHHPCWENNDGADGEIVFDLKAAKVRLVHNSYYTDSETSEYEL